MRLTLEPTDKLVELVDRNTGCATQARLWQGQDDHGVPVLAYICRVSAPLHLAPADVARFEASLKSVAPMRADVASIPLRLIL
jgi:hypothetical protein